MTTQHDDLLEMMNERIDQLSAMRSILCNLEQRATKARHTFPSLKSAASMAAMTLAHDLAVLGQEFIILSVKLKQAARDEAAQEADAVREAQGGRKIAPRVNAEGAAAAMIKNGAYRVQP